MTVALMLGCNSSCMVIISWFSWLYVFVRNLRNAHGVDVNDDLGFVVWVSSSAHTLKLQKWHKIQL